MPSAGADASKLALPPGSEEARLLRRGVEAAAVARFQGRFEEFLR